MINNLREIRELYGATQEQVATAITVNRVTVANWENGSSIASSSNQEKLSLYYGIGPEYFYREPLDDVARQLIKEASAKAREVLERTGGKRVKEDDFNKAFSSLSFSGAMNRYAHSVKMLLAVADGGKLDELKTALLLNQKVATRLSSIIQLREEELNNNEPSLFDLIEEIESRS